METPADFIIICAGIAGASIGYFLAPHGRVVLLERESHPGYHTTGRSAALFTESYGTEQVRALTCASREFFEHPPAGFSEHPLLAPRGAMLVGTHDQAALLEAAYETVRSVSALAQRLDAAGRCVGAGAHAVCSPARSSNRTPLTSTCTRFAGVSARTDAAGRQAVRDAGHRAAERRQWEVEAAANVSRRW